MASSHGEGHIDTVIVGNGPSALILSYILHGHIPYYIGGHSDRLLNDKLNVAPDLTHLTSAIYNFLSSSSSYSSQALPVNALLDSLIRPNGDTTFADHSCVEWRHEPARAASHIVLGNAPHAGGQWADNPVKASWDIGTLSYAEQLSLPGFSIAEYRQRTKHEPLQDMTRPTRNDLTDYLRDYPAAVGIQDAIRTSANVSNISRRGNGFYVEPFGISCKHIVLASGIFNINLPPPHFLSPLSTLSSQQGPVLVIGSGFTAADIIVSTPPHRKIIHLFNWDPVNHPSPLKACHGSAYPEYAWIYRQMKYAAEHPNSHGQRKWSLTGAIARSAPKSSTLYFNQRNWAASYEGFANSRITNLELDTSSAASAATKPNDAACNGAPTAATIDIGRSPLGPSVPRTISAFHYATGRRGSLAYLSPALQREVLLRPHHPPAPTTAGAGASVSSAPKPHDFAAALAVEPPLVSRLTLRDKIDEAADASAAAAGLELADDVFAIGSLTGDSLIRFAYGGCVVVGGAIAERAGKGAGGGGQLDRRKEGKAD